MPAKIKKSKKASSPKWADEAPGYKPPISPQINAAFEGFSGPPDKELRLVTNRALLLGALNAFNELFRRATVFSLDEPSARADVATDYCLRLTMHLTMRLDDLAERPRPVLRDLAQATPFWPSLWCPNAKWVAPFYEKLTPLGVGKNHQLNFRRSAKWRLDGVARAWAFHIVKFVWAARVKVKSFVAENPEGPILWTPETKAAMKLPPLSKATAKEWLDNVGWPLVLAATSGEPEKDPDLKRLGTYRGTEPSRIRDAIKKSLRQALASFAAD